jgi:hypothetical protein
LGLGRAVGAVARVPAAGPHATALTSLYLDFDKLGAAYNGLAADCATKAKQMKQAAEAEQRRHDNLKSTIRTLFGFGG